MDRRERPWKTLRVVVEVKVPPNSKATEKDLLYHVQQHLPATVGMRRPIHKDCYWATVRTKTFGAFMPAHRRLEKGLKVGRPPARIRKDTTL